MTPRQFRKIALSLPGVVESEHQGHPDFRVGGKIVASLGAPDENWAMVKLTPEQQRVMIEVEPKLFRPCSGAWGKQGYTNIQLEAADARVAKSALLLAVQNLTAARPRQSHVSLKDALDWLESEGKEENIRKLQRYGIAAEQPYGVTVGQLQKYAKKVGKDHKLAQGLWDSGRYEARMLAALVDDPEQVTIRQMDRWAKDFDNWAIVDTVCFHLFDRTPHAWKRVPKWATAKPEFKKRAAFALLWALSAHDKAAADERFREGLGWIEKASQDDRDYVKKAVNMALRAIGKRNAELNRASIQTAERLAAAQDKTARWIGKNALRELTSPAVQKRVKGKQVEHTP